ncbi:hypothetical protein KY284_023247 [Solanum tuberosum]|nr:hypothetical protein KY284_023247 [Solanum tuberosum]
MSEKQSRCLNPLPRSYSSQKSSGSPHSSVGFVSVAEARGLCSFLPQLTALKKIIVNTPVVLIPIMNSKYLDLYELNISITLFKRYNHVHYVTIEIGLMTYFFVLEGSSYL